MRPLLYLRRSLFFAISLLIFLFSWLVAERIVQSGEPLPLTQKERKWLSEHPTIRLAPDPDFHPIEFVDENGNYRGIAADYVSILENKLGIKFAVVRLKSWAEVLRRAKRREVDVFGAATKSPQRSKYMIFSKPHIELPGVIIVRDEKKGSFTLPDLLKRK